MWKKLSAYLFIGFSSDGVFSSLYRENMEALLQQHTYARSPLRAHGDGEMSDLDPLKAHLQHMKGK